MKVQLESTTHVVDVDGVPARVWEGKTESGIKVHAFITRIACGVDENTEEFDRELQQQKAPSAEVRAIPLRLLL